MRLCPTTFRLALSDLLQLPLTLSNLRTLPHSVEGEVGGVGGRRRKKRGDTSQHLSGYVDACIQATNQQQGMGKYSTFGRYVAGNEFNTYLKNVGAAGHLSITNAERPSETRWFSQIG